MGTFLLLPIIFQSIHSQLLPKILTVFGYRSVEIITEELQDEDYVLDVQVPLKFATPETISEANGQQLKVLKAIRSWSTLRLIFSLATLNDLTSNVWVILSKVDVMPSIFAKGQIFGLSVTIFYVYQGQNGTKVYQILGTATEHIIIKVSHKVLFLGLGRHVFAPI